MSRFANGSHVLAAVGLMATACQTGPLTAASPRDDGPCNDLARAFYLIAEAREEGALREEQIESLRAGVDSPFVRRPEDALDAMLHIVDLVYRMPESNPRGIEQRVRDNCVENEQGQAIVRAIWPAPEDAAESAR